MGRHILQTGINLKLAVNCKYYETYTSRTDQSGKLSGSAEMREVGVSASAFRDVVVLVFTFGRAASKPAV